MTCERPAYLTVQCPYPPLFISSVFSGFGHHCNSQKTSGEDSMFAASILSVTLYTIIVLGLAPGGAVSQPSLSLTVKPGDTVTLQCCVLMRDPGHLAWFKQDTGRAPLCILSTYSNVNGSTIHNGFSINRFKIQKGSSSFNLSILHVELSDAGLYFCGMIPTTHMEFGNATLLQFEANETAAEKPNPGPCDEYGLLTVLALAGVSAVLLITIVVLIYRLNKRRRYYHSTAFSKDTHLGAFFHQCTRESSIYKQNQDTEVLNHAALSFTESSSRPGRKMTEMDRQAMYSQVQYKQCN
ncbi:uncharacterized protein [Lepisosteus oculatus]|uniref:uncharacterized protein n=1 Tax=Lepisosteus oculatus TaxID=7918 RepID=UPI0035F520DF